VFAHEATGEEETMPTICTSRSRPSVARCASVLVAALAVIGFATGTATAAPSPPPGGDAVYQVEISANVPGPTGGGSWFWLELDRDGGGVYAGSDCGHGGIGAAGSHGPISWVQQGDQLLIYGVLSPELPPFVYDPIVVPAAYGHYMKSFAEVLPALAAFLSSVGADVDGTAQVEVAP
jgi:hypothetical protein